MSIPQHGSAAKPTALPRTVVFVQAFFPPGEKIYRVARRLAAGAILYEEHAHKVEFAAYVAASALAAELTARLQGPALIKARLVVYFRRRGRQMFYADKPRSLCANKFERQGYDVAENELIDATYEAIADEKQCKPHLTDSIPVQVHIGEYGYGKRRVKGFKVAA